MKSILLLASISLSLAAAHADGTMDKLRADAKGAAKAKVVQKVKGGASSQTPPASGTMKKAEDKAQQYVEKKTGN